MSHSSEHLKQSLFNAKKFTKKNKVALFLFWVTLIFTDSLNYFLQAQIAQGQSEVSRVIEISFQLFILFYTVVFIHFVSNRYHQREVTFVRHIGESLLLSPGYLLQAIIYLITVTISLLLLIVPGAYCAIAFYIAPLLSVLYPGYNGKTFMLSQELSKGKLVDFTIIILVTAFLPFIPDGVGLFLTGELNSIWSLWLSPFDGLLFLMSELLVTFFVLSILEERFPQDFADPSISS